jgi:hypothetical protein
MTWWARPLLKTVQGATITLGSTIISCALALQVEKSANRVFFYAAPHKYATVDRAYGLTQEQLESVRHLRMDPTKKNENIPLALNTQQHEDEEESWEMKPIGFSNETLFSTEQKKEVPRIPISVPWQQEMIACSMTG